MKCITSVSKGKMFAENYSQDQLPTPQTKPLSVLIFNSIVGKTGESRPTILEIKKNLHTCLKTSYSIEEIREEIEHMKNEGLLFVENGSNKWSTERPTFH